MTPEEEAALRACMKDPFECELSEEILWTAGHGAGKFDCGDGYIDPPPDQGDKDGCGDGFGDWFGYGCGSDDGTGRGLSTESGKGDENGRGIGLQLGEEACFALTPQGETATAILKRIYYDMEVKA